MRGILRALTLFLFLGAANACRPEPVRPVVDALAIDGVESVDEDALRAGLATTETPRLFGFRGILEYATYDPHVLSRDLLRIERYLRSRGYYQAKVTVARVIHLGKNRVRIQVRVDEGLPVRISKLMPGLVSLPDEAALPVNRARRLQEGHLFDELRFEADKQRILNTLLDLGYAFAQVSATAKVDVARRTAELQYHIEAGPRARFGPVTFIGLREVPEGPVRAALKIREDRLFSESALEDARGELLDLGVFSTVEIVPDKTRPESAIVPIEVRVREAALRTVRVGGGVRFDVLQLQSRLETSWEHRNFLGGMRAFSINARPGLTFYPTRLEELTPPTRLLPEMRVVAKLTQPSFLEGRTTGTLSASYSVAPVLYPLLDLDPEQERIIGYQEVGTRAALNRRFFRRRLIVEPSYNWQANFPFTYQKDKPAGLDNVLVSFPELFVALDLRNDPMRTRSGVYLASALQVAGYGFGGDRGSAWLSDIKVNPEFRAFIPLDRATLGLRLNLGFLFPGNYGETLERNITEIDSEVIHDQQKLNLRAFYSGGPNSNRGYPFRTVGPHGPIGFLAPSNNADCIDFQTDDRCLRPLGGLTLWEASIEARVPFSRTSPLEAVLFVDASDLTRGKAHIRFTAPHLSPGAGLRYLTPVGPIRLDIGWRVPGLQAFGDYDPAEIGRPGPPLFGFFPGAIHLLFGSEAF